MLKALTIFSGNANRELAQAICRYVETPLGRAEVTRFADGEIYVEINENVRGVNCFVVQPTCAPAYSKRLGTSLAIIDKRRPAPNVSEVVNIIGDVRGRDAIIIDDMIDTAGTLCAAAQAVMAQGARAVFACASHGVLSNPAIERISASPIEELIITD